MIVEILCAAGSKKWSTFRQKIYLILFIKLLQRHGCKLNWLAEAYNREALIIPIIPSLNSMYLVVSSLFLSPSLRPSIFLTSCLLPPPSLTALCLFVLSQTLCGHIKAGIVLLLPAMIFYRKLTFQRARGHMFFFCFVC